jgi:hypothetical protein
VKTLHFANFQNLSEDLHATRFAFVESIISLLGFVALISLVAMIVLIFNRARRGEKVSTDKDWQLCFGAPKAEVLTRRYVIKLAIALVGYTLIGLVEYVILLPYGLSWYVAAMAATALVIVPLTPKLLR